MTQETAEQLAVQALALMSPSLSPKLLVILQQNIDAGEPYES